MKFAIVGNERCVAKRGVSARCPVCGQEMIAKCGELRVPHWAHRGRRTCDTWWEPETQWHRSWKAAFPEEWQEIIQKAEDVEKHIADVKTDRGLVIEFQHSPITLDERRSREAFYKKMIWVPVRVMASSTTHPTCRS